MKNLYLKGKGKIHPSPASSPSVGGGGGGGQADVLAVLRLLPAAILALTTALRAEDKEVLGYLILRSISGGEAAEADAPHEERRRGRRPLGGGGGGGGAYRAAFDCDCFDCYTSFWSRWDCSPNRELIHQAIEAFEEHLASRERGGGRGRRRERNRADKAKKQPDGAAEEEMGVSQIVATEAGGENGSGDNGVVEKAEVDFRDEQGEGCAVAEAEAAEEETEQQAAAESGDRRRGWADVMVLMNSGFWSLWSPRG